MTNGELARALQMLSALLEENPEVTVDEQLREAVSNLVGEVSRRKARLVIDTNLSALTSWLGKFRKPGGA